MKMPDFINHPPHYGDQRCIESIQAALSPEEFEGFLKGNAIKYLWRAGKKGEKSADYQKAHWYVSRLIAHSEPAPEEMKEVNLDGLRNYQQRVTFCQAQGFKPESFEDFVKSQF